MKKNVRTARVQDPKRAAPKRNDAQMVNASCGTYVALPTRSVLITLVFLQTPAALMKGSVVMVNACCIALAVLRKGDAWTAHVLHLKLVAPMNESARLMVTAFCQGHAARMNDGALITHVLPSVPVRAVHQKQDVVMALVLTRQ
jgi:hypothetical protein